MGHEGTLSLPEEGKGDGWEIGAGHCKMHSRGCLISVLLTRTVLVRPWAICQTILFPFCRPEFPRGQGPALGCGLHCPASLSQRWLFLGSFLRVGGAEGGGWDRALGPWCLVLRILQPFLLSNPLQADSHSEGAIRKPDLFSQCWFENPAFWGQEGAGPRRKENCVSGKAARLPAPELHTLWASRVLRCGYLLRSLG